MVYFISRIIFKIILKLFFRFEIRNKENVPRSGPFILASNHVSHVDPAPVGVACHTARVSFMAKKELFETPVFGWWFKAVGCIPIERYSGSFAPLKKAVRKLKEGGVIGIFPEGTRSPDGSLRKAEPGIALVAAKSHAPVIPLYLSGTQKALPIGAKFLRISKVKATIGEAVNIEGAVEHRDKRTSYEAFGEKVMAAISNLKNE